MARPNREDFEFHMPETTARLLLRVLRRWLGYPLVYTWGIPHGFYGKTQKAWRFPTQVRGDSPRFLRKSVEIPHGNCFWI